MSDNERDGQGSEAQTFPLGDRLPLKPVVNRDDNGVPVVAELATADLDEPPEALLECLWHFIVARRRRRRYHPDS